MAYLQPCPECGSLDLEEEATGGLEIHGICYQSCWIECNYCHFEGPTLELDDSGKNPFEYQDVRDAWNNIEVKKLSSPF